MGDSLFKTKVLTTFFAFNLKLKSPNMKNGTIVSLCSEVVFSSLSTLSVYSSAFCRQQANTDGNVLKDLILSASWNKWIFTRSNVVQDAV